MMKEIDKKTISFITMSYIIRSFLSILKENKTMSKYVLMDQVDAEEIFFICYFFYTRFSFDTALR